MGTATHEIEEIDILIPRQRLDRSRLVRILPLSIGAIFSAFVFWWTQLTMLTHSDWSWSSIRVFGWSDQFSYVAEVVNGSHGNLRGVEPFTETGTSNDPHLYYQILGGISYITGITPTDVWNIVGVALQVILVMCISIAAAMITRRWWASFFGAVPFLVGTLSFANSNWFTWVGQFHAVLWGAFAVMFALNSESASLAIAGCLYLFLLTVAVRRPRRRTLLWAGTFVGAGVGLLANFHTYGYIAALFIGIYCLSAYAIAAERKWWFAGLSLVLIVALFQVGPPFADSVGRLAALVLGIVPAVPGIVIAIRRWGSPVVAPLVASVITASPQVIGTLVALQTGNAFLKYREASSVGLGVDWRHALWAALPLLIPLVMITIAGIHRRNPLWIGYPVGAIIAWLLIAKNDVWGANQEPYRLWIDGFALVAFTLIPIALDVAITYLSPRRSNVARAGIPWRLVIAVFSVATLVVGSISSIDWFRFYKLSESKTMALYEPVDHSMVVLASAVTNENLVMTDACTNIEIFKVVTGARIAGYSLGLAWPTRWSQINTALWELTNRTVSSAQLGAAQIGWLVTQAGCTPDWAEKYSSLLTWVKTSHYGPTADDVLTLWRIKTSS